MSSPWRGDQPGSAGRTSCVSSRRVQVHANRRTRFFAGVVGQLLGYWDAPTLAGADAHHEQLLREDVRRVFVLGIPSVFA